MYKEDILGHYHSSPFRGSLEIHDFSSDTSNPSCGDTITFQGKIQSNTLIDIKFTGTGCVISQATASMLSSLCKDKPIEEIRHFDAHVVKSLLGINLGPTRLRCALLSLEALQQGINTYLQGNYA